MREPDFTAIVRQLEKSGISSGHANRTVNELRDHYDDLVDAAVDGGADSRKARQIATSQLGDMGDFVAEMAARRELKTWAFRYPRLAVLFYPLACVAVLPAMPVLAGITHRAYLMKWGASLLLGALATATLLLVMQLSIILG